jgi:hypothetical protein
MAERADEPEFVGLAAFLASLVEEIVEAVHSAQIAQSEEESELRAAASLDIEAAAEKLVAADAAQMLLDQLMAESGARAAWTARHTEFLRLVEDRLGIALEPNNDYNERGLTNAGNTKTLAGARRSIACEQLQVVQRLLSEGPRRVKIGSGVVSVKLEMRAYLPRIAAISGDQKPIEAKNSVKKRNRTVPGLRINVRPAHREDGEVGSVFGEIKINFIVV